MTLGGVSIILILGICNFVLLLFQLVTGLRFIKVPFGTHKKIGMVLVFVAFVHGALAILAG
jgi:hypothetical protein